MPLLRSVAAHDDDLIHTAVSTMNGSQHARTLAAYNRWMNEKLYAASAHLTDAQRKADCGAFFKSIHGTLNHLLLVDHLWMARFTGMPFTAPALDHELHADFGALRAARSAMDETIERWAATLDDTRLSGPLEYTSLVGAQPRRMPFDLAVVHFFNHQTHHRGQVTTLLSQHGIDPGSTDLVAMPPDRRPTT